MIKNVRIVGLRGKSFDLALGAVNLVIGQNTAGKTTIADAIRWGLLGYIPGMAQPPRGWAELLGNGETSASVELKLDDSTILLTMALEKGSLKMAGQPNAANVNVLTLDPAQFFAATGPKKAQLIAEASSSGWDWRALVPEARRNGALKSPSMSWPQWVGQAIEAAKDQRIRLADRKKTLTQTLRGLESIRGIVIGDDVKLKAELTETQQKLGVLKDQSRAVTQQIQNVQQTQGASKAQARLDQVRRSLSEFIGQSHDADTHEARFKECKQRLEEFNLKSELPGPHRLGDMRTGLTRAQSDVAVEESRIKQAEAGLETIKAKYAKLKKAKACPTCGATGKLLADAIKKAEQAETEGQLRALQTARGKHEAAAQHCKILQEQIAALDKSLDEKAALEIELSALKDEARLLDLWREHDELVSKVQTEQVYDVQALEERRYEFQCEIEDAGETIEGLERELAEITYKRSQKRQLDEIELQLERAEQGWTEQNAAVADLEVLRERFTAMSLEPILETVGLFTQGIFAQPLSLDGVELGRMVGNRWVPLQQFSGAEQAVAYAALTSALQGDAKKESIVLADELSAFDDEHLTRFMKNVMAAVEAGKLAQFIGFSTPRKNVKAWPKAVLVKAI